MGRKLKVTEMGRLTVEEFRRAEKMPLVVVLDNVRSMYNVGSVFRTSDAYRVERIVLCGITGRPPHPEIHKTALGAEESVAWTYCADAHEAVTRLKADGYTVLAVEQAEDSIDLSRLQATQYKAQSRKMAVIFGNEVKGVQQSVVDLCDGCLELPQFGTKHSLNVSTTAGIVIWEFFKLNHTTITPSPWQNSISEAAK
ncbi:MAG: RNA methyltransferase [Bacteroidaceae bacterium]|nr:RNA methyltransferase [Bacteroidaceae bacterium]